MYTAVSLAKKINEYLKVKNLSQKDMLKTCHLSKNTISSMLSRGSIPRADTLAIIADYLDCSLDSLFERNYAPEELSPEEKHLVKSFRIISQDGRNEILLLLNMKVQNKKKILKG